MEKNERIKIGKAEGHVTISVNDAEVFDFLDDHLVECGLEFDYLKVDHSQGRTEYVLHFLEHDDPSRIKRVISLIPPEEIERIWLLNN